MTRPRACGRAREAARGFPQLELIPAIELSTDLPGAEVHLLGYFVDEEDAEFQRTLRRFREGRVERGRAMVERLNRDGPEHLVGPGT